jgi:hypothetical protein
MDGSLYIYILFYPWKEERPYSAGLKTGEPKFAGYTYY